jgi:chromosome segregation ATPase
VETIKAFKRDGKKHLVSRVKEDLKFALQGKKQLDDIVEEQSVLVQMNLPSEQKLLNRFASLRRVNSVSDVNMLGDENDSETESYFDDESSNLDDNFLLNMADDEETMELLESSLMSKEDLMCKYEKKIEKLELTIREISLQEKKHRHSCEDLTSKLDEYLNDIKKMHSSESALKHKYDRLQKKVEDDTIAHTSMLDNMNKRISSLEQTVDEKDRVIGESQRMLLLKEQELDRIRQNVDALQNDLESANKMRKSYEDEAQRTKNEMRTQMDRLRGNMHNMLQQGTEQSKVLEMQNSLLHSDALRMRDECDSLKQNKSLIEQEMSYLRKELKDIQIANKGLSDDSNSLRIQVSFNKYI